MSTKRSFEERSYKQHAEHFCEYAFGAKEEHGRTWLLNDTVDAWRHQRMYETLDPILRAEPKANWLTVGDGRYGKDARYILDKGCDAMASDISEVLLKKAKDIGYIPRYSIENAEALSFGDSEFDYVFCKESYHHFPRPIKALYEMLRVARKGVFLIEPNDPYISDSLFAFIMENAKNMLQLLLGKDIIKHGFEDSGNYVYSISKRELEKVALGLNYKILACKGINDWYIEGVEYEKLLSKGPLQKKIKTRINIANLFARMGLLKYGLLSAIIFKEEPSKELLKELTNGGFEITTLPDNPYISD